MSDDRRHWRLAGPDMQGSAAARAPRTERRDGLPESLDDERAILEELSGERPVARPSRGWLLALAAMSAVICTGFVGHQLEPGAGPDPIPVPTGQAPAPVVPVIEILEPRDGALVGQGIVHVRLRSNEPRVRLNVAVELGDAVLGWLSTRADDDGVADAVVPVFAPRARVPVDIVATGTVDGRAAETRRPVELVVDGPVDVWTLLPVRSTRDALVVKFAGTAPLTIASLSAALVDGTGAVVARADLANAMDPARPGSSGGLTIGLGSFRGTLRLPGSTTRSLLLRITWTDPVDGRTWSRQQAVPSDPVR